MDVPIDLALNAFQNSKKLFDAKKAAGKKKEKTIQSSIKALKNAEAKAKATLETVGEKHIITIIILYKNYNINFEWFQLSLSSKTQKRLFLNFEWFRSLY